jgi:excisionase family DNA binding protein
MIEINSSQFKALVADAVNEALEPHMRKLTMAPTMKPVYTPIEAMGLLGISKRTLQYLRDSKQISFVQHGRKIHFRAADIQEYLDNNRISRRNVA